MAVFSAADLMHPFDESARRELESTAGLSAAVAAFTRICQEHENDMPRAGQVRLGPDRLPDVHRLLAPVCEAFGLAEPAMYLDSDPAPTVPADGMHAHASAPRHTSIVLTAELLDLLATEEIEAVLAHECGHIVMSHGLYHAMNRFVSADDHGDLAAPPLRTALENWSRRSELSADRAAAAYLGSADAMTRAIFRFAGATMDPATLHSVQTPDPTLAIRIRELQAWTATPGFARSVLTA